MAIRLRWTQETTGKNREMSSLRKATSFTPSNIIPKPSYHSYLFRKSPLGKVFSSLIALNATKSLVISKMHLKMPKLLAN